MDTINTDLYAQLDALGKTALRIKAERDELLRALKRLRDSVYQCMHLERHRGGAIWTICTDCGKQWADDEGGFKPDEPSAAMLAADAAIRLAEWKQ